jgi:hypothetical protein
MVDHRRAILLNEKEAAADPGRRKTLGRDQVGARSAERRAPFGEEGTGERGFIPRPPAVHLTHRGGTRRRSQGKESAAGRE